MPWVIEHHDGVARFYSFEIAREMAATSGWTDNPEKAFQFARRKDALNFLQGFLRHAADHADAKEIP